MWTQPNRAPESQDLPSTEMTDDETKEKIEGLNKGVYPGQLTSIYHLPLSLVGGM